MSLIENIRIGSMSRGSVKMREERGERREGGGERGDGESVNTCPSYDTIRVN